MERRDGDTLSALFEAAREDGPSVLEGLGELEQELFAQDEASEPAQWGRYERLERLGQGGHGIVYAARDPELDRKVAIKLVRTGKSGSIQEQRLLREARALSRLDHPHVVSIYDVGHLPQGVCLVMKLVEGKPLDQWWWKAKRPWTEIVEVFIQAAEALAAAHELGIVHRDFKPANALVETTESGPHVTVLDFGLAFDVSLPDSGPQDAPTEPRLTETGVAVGTPLYMSPEQHARGDLDGRSDQYSLCAVLYQALFGPLPWAKAHLRQIAVLKREGVTIPETPDVPPELAALVQRGLSPYPEERFASMTELIDALRALRRRPRSSAWVGWAAVAIAATIGLLLTRLGSCANP